MRHTPKCIHSAAEETDDTLHEVVLQRGASSQIRSVRQLFMYSQMEERLRHSTVVGVDKETVKKKFAACA